MRRLRLHHLSALLLVCFTALSIAWSEGKQGGEAPTTPSARPIPERLDNPPAPRAARENLQARSPSFNVTFGFYVSHQVNVDSLGNNIVGDAANEPSIAVNPVNPANMVIGWRQFDSITSNFRQAGYGYTFDGGQTWTFPGSLEPGIFRSDPVLDADSAGNIYYQSLRFVTTLDVFVFKSTDGGIHWSAPVAEFGGDKNWIAIDRTGGIGDGHIYGIWQRFGGSCCGSNVLTRSANAGVSFETPVAVSLSPTFGTMAVGPDGTLFASGIDGTTTQDLNTFVVSRSLDAKNAAVSPTSSGVQVDLGGRMGVSSGPNPAGLLGEANVAVDSSGSATNGNVYLLASLVPDIGPDPLDVHFSRSIDGGQTWSPFVRVNDDASTSNWQWFGAHSVAPNGRIDVVWNDTRLLGLANMSQLFYSYSYDAGVSWAPNVAVSPTFNSFLGWPQQNKLGDYYTIVSSDTGADVAYAATFNGEQDVYHLRVFPDCNNNGIPDETDIANMTSVDCDASRVPDECQTGAGFGAGMVPDGSQGGSAPLTVRHLGADLELSWDDSCSPNDVDYALYFGDLGDFSSHNALLCSTFGEKTMAIPSTPGNTYYLIAPTTLTQVGSLGQASNGVERPQGSEPCLPQKILDCCTVP